LSEAGKIDLIYADAARLSLMACVPYGWQFPDEDVFMPSEQGGGLNCFALLTRENRCHFTTSCQRVTSEVGEVDCRGVRSCLGTSSRTHTRASSGVGEARLIFILSAALLAAPEHRGNLVAQVEI
jgi:hypothetical protein